MSCPISCTALESSLAVARLVVCSSWVNWASSVTYSLPLLGSSGFWAWSWAIISLRKSFWPRTPFGFSGVAEVDPVGLVAAAACAVGVVVIAVGPFVGSRQHVDDLAQGRASWPTGLFETVEHFILLRSRLCGGVRRGARLSGGALFAPLSLGVAEGANVESQ